jgi:hypothetical protein
MNLHSFQLEALQPSLGRHCNLPDDAKATFLLTPLLNFRATFFVMTQHPSWCQGNLPMMILQLFDNIIATFLIMYVIATFLVTYIITNLLVTSQQPSW